MPGRITTGDWSQLPPQSVFVSAEAPIAPAEISIVMHRIRAITLLILFIKNTLLNRLFDLPFNINYILP